jgi:probable HAF family extracellular repeat protein
MVDLNSLIDPQSGWVLASASGINDSGQITGTGIYQGQTHAFLITPPSVPEPSPPLLIVVGVLCLVTVGQIHKRLKGSSHAG